MEAVIAKIQELTDGLSIYYRTREVLELIGVMKRMNGAVHNAESKNGHDSASVTIESLSLAVLMKCEYGSNGVLRYIYVMFLFSDQVILYKSSRERMWRQISDSSSYSYFTISDATKAETFAMMKVTPFETPTFSSNCLSHVIGSTNQVIIKARSTKSARRFE